MPTDATNATWLKPFNEIRRAVADDGVWGGFLGAPGSRLPSCGIHLAVFVEPFLGYVLGGSKTVMIGNVIQNQFTQARDWPFGAAASLLLMALVMVMLLIVLRRDKDQLL